MLKFTRMCKYGNSRLPHDGLWLQFYIIVPPPPARGRELNQTDPLSSSRKQCNTTVFSAGPGQTLLSGSISTFPFRILDGMPISNGLPFFLKYNLPLDNSVVLRSLE